MWRNHSALEPGARTDCTAAQYTVTPEDVARTYVQNTATVTGTPEQGGVVQAAGTDSVRIPAEDSKNLPARLPLRFDRKHLHLFDSASGARLNFTA